MTAANYKLRAPSPDVFDVMKKSFHSDQLASLAMSLGNHYDALIDLSSTSLRKCADAFFRCNNKQNQSFIIRILGELENGIGEINPEDVSHEFLSALTIYLSQCGYANTSIKYAIGYIKRIIKWSTLYGAIASPTLSKPIKMAVQPYKIALRYDELIKIASYPIHLMHIRKDTREAYERARDTFVLACNLGQRWSDVKQVSPDNFADGVYRCYQRKTGNYATVDIDKLSIDPLMTRAILDRYTQTCPWKKSYRNLATTLKHFFRAIGMTEMVQYFEPTMQDSRCKSVKKPKWDLVTMHSARRTFITLNSERGISPQLLMKASGHASVGSFSRYVCV